MEKPRTLVILTILVLIAGGFYLKTRYDYFIDTPADPSYPGKISVIIKKGESIASIAHKLGQKNLILDESAFEWYNRFNHTDKNILAGRFLLNRTMKIPEIVKTISDPKKNELVLVVPEGSTISDIDQKLADLDAIAAGDFITAAKNFKNFAKYSFLDSEKSKSLPHPLEGFLFPDTYFLGNAIASPDLIELMLKNFQKKWQTLDSAKIAAQIQIETQAEIAAKTPLEIIIVASIIEKEVRTDTDRPIVAGILWKRLKNHWQLGADATLLYLKKDQQIDANDLQQDSPYNTRKFVGLPPGPICNPGLKSILAALNPQQSEYFYYLTKPGSGEVVYAKTNDEQNQNRAKYLN